jgi:hypothetical protein
VSTPSSTDHVVPRRAGEPAPDLTDYRVVHRAMTVDLDRLAVAAAGLVARPDRRRNAALRWYLRGISHEIESHHHVEDEYVWPVVVATAGERAALVELTADHERLDPLLHRAAALAARPRVTPELVAVLRETADLLVRHVDDEERDVFGLITEFVRVEDYVRLQERFRGNLRPRLLPFVVPWVICHATEEERATIGAEAPRVLRLILAAFRPRFAARQALLFG